MSCLSMSVGNITSSLLLLSTMELSASLRFPIWEHVHCTRLFWDHSLALNICYYRILVLSFGWRIQCQPQVTHPLTSSLILELYSLINHLVAWSCHMTVWPHCIPAVFHLILFGFYLLCLKDQPLYHIWMLHCFARLLLSRCYCSRYKVAIITGCW